MYKKVSAILLIFVVAFICFDTSYAAKKTTKRTKIEQAKTKKSNAQKAKKQSKKDEFTHLARFFALTYASMPAAKKYRQLHKLVFFWMLCSLYAQIFV